MVLSEEWYYCLQYPDSLHEKSQETKETEAEEDASVDHAEDPMTAEV